ncbi:DUF1380 family protein [Pantoea allii]|uniref:DUF1380 domain-containing protein n=1 Tax=Pantoea allii TaxID=574096 RepID=A0ABS6VL33_9GAMM|nr:DUF1380 family protein [Pantoea allii]MBW1215784.1 DUF1380 domain-containing protein [Pantoea allii]MBW1254646.1 DUF1380 domain-containing protein [Pantoea allii]MBW1259473.1 DUF1380 domain-containing protein [Pantoea allii]MBW1263694.1 DUF1380 domain-containing protein [Pantoea allii]MBW1268481.1 DUF1380 domain-containing protein [Pantoea allii]
MYGTVNEVCEQLRQRYKSDELMTLIVWTKEDVIDVLDDESVSADAADEILCRIASVDAQHVYGVSQDTLQAIADMMRDEKEQAREVTLPATAAETVVSLAWEFMRLHDAQSGEEGAAARLYPAQAEALRRVGAALEQQRSETVSI